MLSIWTGLNFYRLVKSSDSLKNFYPKSAFHSMIAFFASVDQDQTAQREVSASVLLDLPCPIIYACKSLSQITSFRLFQTERVCRRLF